MFRFSDEQLMVRQMLRKWVQDKLRPARDALERNEIEPYALMRDFMKAFGVADLVRAGFEKKASAAPGPGSGEGGLLGGDPALSALMAIEICRENPGFFLAFGASLGLCGGAIMAKGTPEQKRRFGQPELTLEKIGCWGMTEPGAGSDAFGAMRTVARRDGDAYVLSGQKTFITNAPFADVCVVYAKIDRGDGTPLAERPIDAFVVERGTPGLVQGKSMRKMGMHSSPTGELFLEDCRVPAENLLGGAEKAAGRQGARDVFHNERTGMAPMCIGIIETCLETATAYARERVAWGKPIAEYQLVQEKLARMFVHKQNCENLLFKQLWLGKQKLAMSPAEASATKLYCAQAATECALEAVQILGGNGYMAEYHVEQLMRDAKLLQIGGGTDEIQILHIARWLLKE
jgi:alkylation response protein AidB-like acyl-CoA dehydrogenase